MKSIFTFPSDFFCLNLGLLICIIPSGNYPEPLRSKEDIKSCPSNTEDIDIRELPLGDYPLLSKFKRLKRVSFANYESSKGMGATDEKLKIFSDLIFTNLLDISLFNCPSVTDEGFRTLVKIPTLRMLQLEGTSITDSSLDVIASKMRLTGVNVANCPTVTAKGLAFLARSDTLRNLTFSANNMNQEEVLQLFDLFKTNVTRCEIIDTDRKLITAPLKAKAASRRIQCFVYSKGALQMWQSGVHRRDKL